MKISAALIVVSLGAIYVSIQKRRVRKPSTRIKKLARNLIASLIPGLVATFLFTTFYTMTLAPDTFGAAGLQMGQISGLD